MNSKFIFLYMIEITIIIILNAEDYNKCKVDQWTQADQDDTSSFLSI